MSFLDELNPIQRAACEQIVGPVLIIAGPGSGKTRVLTYRIANLIQSGVAPWEILALTFTNKSAREMKERIEKVVGSKANSIWAGTFHSIFARILRSEADKIGFPKSFTIYDTDDSTSLISTIIKEMNLNKDIYKPNMVRSRISSAKSAVKSPRRYRADAEWMQQDKLALRPQIIDIYEKYVVRCKRAGAMDFDDLLFQLYALFHANPDNVKEKYQQKFKHLLVDEFQDTNYLQYAIVRQLTNFPGSTNNVCVVGDDAQSIYAFRGATIDNILDFSKEFSNLKTFKLEQNYRSTHHIVQAANDVIGYNRKQLKKTIWTDKEDRTKIKLLKTISDDEEARRVVDFILEQKNRNHLYNSDIAILYRTNAQSRVFEEKLRQKNVTYKVFGGQSFYQRKEIKDFIGYLRLVVNSKDEEALKRVINYPTRGIGDSTLDKIAAIASETERTMFDCLLEAGISARTLQAILSFKQMIEGFAARVATEDAYQLALEIARKSGIYDGLKSDKSVEGQSRFENLVAVLDGIKAFTESDEESPTAAAEIAQGDKSLAAYLQTILLLTDSDSENATNDFVTLMSVHAAKGLEFRSVFVTGMEESLFPSFMSIDTPGAIEEERRLFYVAITRAKDFLVISHATSRMRHGQTRQNDPSRFLDEISSEHYEIPRSGAGGLDAATRQEINPRASVTGSFASPRRTATAFQPKIDSENFKASPLEEIVAGVRVLHLKFGAGKVTAVEGAKDTRVATIVFEDDYNTERKIMLKFAKVQVV
jgi:DNA helicase II / ATP-dependent DNA helicase PcrA